MLPGKPKQAEKEEEEKRGGGGVCRHFVEADSFGYSQYTTAATKSEIRNQSQGPLGLHNYMISNVFNFMICSYFNFGLTNQVHGERGKKSFQEAKAGKTKCLKK